MHRYCLAIDIGASSGRHIVGREENGEIITDEVYRFPNGAACLNGHLVWETETLFEHVVEGIRKAFEKYPALDSIAIDTWGVDYVLMRGREKAAPCFSYRDERTLSAIEEVHGKIPFETLYTHTGIQFQPFNTIYQLYDDKKKGRLQGVTDFLMVPEYLNFLLTGVKMHEYTNATTTGLVNAQTAKYDEEIIASLGLPAELFGTLHSAGSLVGNLKPEIAAKVGGNCDVVLCASHDTASAVEGIPMQGDQPYISSGTWSLLGIKSPEAHTDADSCRGNWSNEGGVGYVRYQKNIMGLWVVQSLKKELCPDKTFSEIADEARESKFSDYVDINDNAFLSPQSMKSAFDAWFAAEKSAPQSESDYFRSAFISLAVSYMESLRELEQNTKQKFDELYIVGGGAKNELLNEMTEQICKIKVKALPIEATAIGNLKIQLQRGNKHE